MNLFKKLLLLPKCIQKLITNFTFLVSGAHCPSKPDVLVRGRSEMHISWKPPEVPQGKLTRYDLAMNGDVIYSGTDLHYTVLRLRPDTEYTFIVSKCVH